MKASTGSGGTNCSVNGYMVLLYLVAIPQCEPQLPASNLVFNFAYSYTVCRINNTYGW